MLENALLLVEDNADDIFIMQRALNKARIDLPLFIANDGKEALDYLSGNAQYADRTRYPLPAVIFLDLKLPYLNGFEVLEWIRQHPALRDLQVIVLTSSGEERDQKRAEQLGIGTYLIKPPKPETLRQALQSVLEVLREPRAA